MAAGDFSKDVLVAFLGRAEHNQTIYPKNVIPVTNSFKEACKNPEKQFDHELTFYNLTLDKDITGKVNLQSFKMTGEEQGYYGLVSANPFSFDIELNTDEGITNYINENDKIQLIDAFEEDREVIFTGYAQSTPEEMENLKHIYPVKVFDRIKNGLKLKFETDEVKINWYFCNNNDTANSLAHYLAQKAGFNLDDLIFEDVIDPSDGSYLTVPYAHFEKGKQAIKEFATLIEAILGKAYMGPDDKLYFNYPFNDSDYQDIDFTFDDNIQRKIEKSSIKAEYNKVVVEYDNFNIAERQVCWMYYKKDNYDKENDLAEMLLPAGETSSWINIEWVTPIAINLETGSPEILVEDNQGNDMSGYFQYDLDVDRTGGKVRFHNNSSDTDIYIQRFKIYGQPLEKFEGNEQSYTEVSSPTKSLNYSNKYIQDNIIAELNAKYKHHYECKDRTEYSFESLFTPFILPANLATINKRSVSNQSAKISEYTHKARDNRPVTTLTATEYIPVPDFTGTSDGVESAPGGPEDFPEVLDTPTWEDPALTTEIEENSQSSTANIIANWIVISDAVSYQLRWQKGDGDWSYTEVGESKHKISPLITNTEYSVQVRAIGGKNGYSLWSALKSITTVKDTTSPEDPIIISSQTDFSGETATITWEEPTDTDYKNTKAEVEVGGSIVRTEYTSNTYYNYTSEKNIKDNGSLQSNITINITHYDQSENSSNTVSTILNNEAPPDVGGLSVSSSVNQIQIDMNRPDILDYNYLIAKMSLTNDVAAADTVYEGEDYQNINIPALGDGTHYVWTKYVDKFGQESNSWVQATTEAQKITEEDMQGEIFQIQPSSDVAPTTELQELWDGDPTTGPEFSSAPTITFTYPINWFFDMVRLYPSVSCNVSVDYYDTNSWVNVVSNISIDSGKWNVVEFNEMVATKKLRISFDSALTLYELKFWTVTMADEILAQVLTLTGNMKVQNEDGSVYIDPNGITIDNSAAENESGAQDKADDAESNAKSYAEPEVHRSTSAPVDTTKLWLDTSVSPNLWKQFNGDSWIKATPENSDIDALQTQNPPAEAGADTTGNHHAKDQHNFDNLAGNAADGDLDLNNNGLTIINGAFSLITSDSKYQFDNDGIYIDTPQFSLDKQGNAEFGGTLSAASGTFEGSLSAVSGQVDINETSYGGRLQTFDDNSSKLIDITNTAVSGWIQTDTIGGSVEIYGENDSLNPITYLGMDNQDLDQGGALKLYDVDGDYKIGLTSASAPEFYMTNGGTASFSVQTYLDGLQVTLNELPTSNPNDTGHVWNRNGILGISDIGSISENGSASVGGSSPEWADNDYNISFSNTYRDAIPYVGITHPHIISSSRDTHVWWKSWVTDANGDITGMTVHYINEFESNPTIYWSVLGL
jgi:hypothetical protein